MNVNLRKTVIAGNWKMNKTPAEAVKLIEELKPVCENKKACDIVACVPFVDLPAALEAAKGTDLKIGAQNVHFEKSGAFTGEISAGMLKELGVGYVIVGHSERRQYFGETDETVNKRTKAALEAGLTVILCVGEVLAERKSGITNEILSLQIKLDLADVNVEQLKNIIIAYEPVWAIGTGETATPAQAQDACAHIRKTLADLYGDCAANATTIQYGGSMNAGNAKELLACPDVDGGLIGGASLKSADFGVIIDAAQ